MRFWLLLILLFSNSALAEEGGSCSANFAQLSSTELYQLARRERAKAVASFIASGAKKVRNHMKEIWVEDYLGAWKEGRNISESSLLFLLRSVLAPRSRAKDLALREQELKSFHAFTFALDPIVDGSVEVASKAKQLFGFRPIEKGLSIPASVISGSFIYGAMFAKIKDWKKQKIEASASDGTLGADALMEWIALGQIPEEELVRQANDHAKILIRWLNELDKKSNRTMPPRFLQFRIEGILKNQEEALEFENILLDVLEENQKRRAKGEMPIGDTYVKAEIFKRISEHPSFRELNEGSRILLTTVFDPPVFLGGKKQNMDWYKDLLTGNMKSYEKLRAHSDIVAWKASLDSKSITDIFGVEASAVKAMYTYNQGLEENQKIIAEKKKEWLSNQALPAEKSYLADRTDLVFNVEPKILWIDLEGNSRELSSELEHWVLLASHPSFSDLRSEWLKGDTGDQKIYRATRERLALLAEIHSWQAAKLKLARETQPDRKKPLDPVPQEVCVLKQENRLFSQLLDRGVSPICSYFQGVHVWRWLAANEISYREGGEKYSLAAAKQKAIVACEEPEATEKLARAFQIEIQEVDEAVRCR